MAQQERLYRQLSYVLRPYFKRYDTNGDGVVDFEEFRVICQEVSQDASKEAQRAIFDRMDTDRNGKSLCSYPLLQGRECGQLWCRHRLCICGTPPYREVTKSAAPAICLLQPCTCVEPPARRKRTYGQLWCRHRLYICGTPPSRGRRSRNSLREVNRLRSNSQTPRTSAGTLEYDEFVDCMLTLTRKSEELEGLQKDGASKGMSKF